MDNPNKIENKKIISGFIWHFGERISAQLVSTIVSIILARLIAPNDYGLIALVLVFINISYVFISGGISDALIQNQKSDDNDFSTMLYVNILISIIVYAVLFFSSPYIAKFYNNDAITVVFRVLSLKIVISSVNALQHTYCTKYMLFKKFFLSTIVGTIVSGVVGVIMAVMGFGIWALVAQYLINSILDTVILSVTIPWKPKLYFSIQSAKKYLAIGWKLMLANLTSAVYNEVRSLLIGKAYTPADLAFYNKGEQFPKLIINNVSNTLCSVMFPALATVNTNPKELKQMIRLSMRCNTFIIFPILAGMAAVSENFLVLLLTEKWIKSVPFMQIACIYYAFEVVNAANLQGLTAFGKNMEVLKIQLVTRIVAIIVLFLVLKKGVALVAATSILIGFLFYIMQTFYNNRFLDYGMLEQLKDIQAPLSISIIMFFIVRQVDLISDSHMISIVLQIIVGLVFYVFFSWIFNKEIFMKFYKLFIKFRK